MEDFSNIKSGTSNPSALMLDTYHYTEANQNFTFESIIPKDNTNTGISTQSYSAWQINDGWEVDILDDKRIAIKKFKIDTWGLRQIHINDDNGNVNKFSVKVTGLEYVHQNIIKHTAGSDVVDGFTQAYCGTGGYITKWYPGQFITGNYIQGLGIQKSIGYAANQEEADDGFQMGKHPWDVGKCSVIKDGSVVGTSGDNTYKAISIGLFGGVQNAASWHDETGEAYKQYDISDHPIIIDLRGEDTTVPIDVSSVEVWDAYVGDTQVYHKNKTVENCWLKYGMAEEKQTSISIGNMPYYDTILPSANNSHMTKMFPLVSDLAEHLITIIGKPFIKFNCAINNEAVWNVVKEYTATHPFIYCQVDDNEDDENYSDYKQANNNYYVLSNRADGYGWLSDSDISGDLTICFDGHFYAGYFPDNFRKINLNKLTIKVLQDNLQISSAQFLFRMIRAKTIEILDKNGNSKNDFIAAYDCSGMFEQAVPPTVIPDIIDFTVRNDIIGYTNTGYMFDYCGNITEIAQKTGVDRFDSTNELKCSVGAQMFQACGKLQKIGPVLNIAAVNFENSTSAGTDGYHMFSGCTALTDARIKGVNGSYVNFADGNYHGLLSALDTDSVEYLFANLVDLTEYDPTLGIMTVNNSFTIAQWIKNQDDYFNDKTNKPSIGVTIKYIDTNCRQSANSENMLIYTTEEISNYFNFECISESEYNEDTEVIWKSGDTEVVLTDNWQQCINTAGATGGFIVRSKTAQTRYVANTVRIYMQKCYDEGAPHAEHGELHCPAEWADKVTDDMIAAATAKNWTIYIGDELKN